MCGGSGKEEEGVRTGEEGERGIGGERRSGRGEANFVPWGEWLKLSHVCPWIFPGVPSSSAGHPDALRTQIRLSVLETAPATDLLAWSLWVSVNLMVAVVWHWCVSQSFMH